MTRQEKINAALAVAVHAIPQQIAPSVSDLEQYRIDLSADVTAHCRREGLLTDTEFVCYGVAYFENFTKAIPSVYDDDGLTCRHGDPGVGHDRPLIPVAVDEDLRREFHAIANPHHPLFKHVRTFPAMAPGSHSLLRS